MLQLLYNIYFLFLFNKKRSFFYREILRGPKAESYINTYIYKISDSTLNLKKNLWYEFQFQRKKKKKNTEKEAIILIIFIYSLIN